MNDEIEWQIEDWIPAEHAIGGKGYWHPRPRPFECEASARLEFEKSVEKASQPIRLIRVLRTPIDIR